MELVRTFKQFMSRRKIRDLVAWAHSMGFTSDEELATWCTNQDIHPPDQGIFGKNEPTIALEAEKEPVEQKSPPRKKKSAKTKKANDPTWVPAAERSRKVRGRKPEVKPKDEVNNEDEENTGTTKKSNTK